MKAIKSISKSDNGDFRADLIPDMLLLGMVVLFFIIGGRLNSKISNQLRSSIQNNYSSKTSLGNQEQMSFQADNKINKNTILMTPVSHKKVVQSAEPNASIFSQAMKTDKEEKIGIESWMTTSKYFEQTNNLYIDEVDKPIQIEDWMLNSVSFISLPETFQVENDKAIQIENWMTDKNLWHQ